MEKQTHKFERFYNYQNYQIIDCQTCGFRHLHPFPTESDLQRFYHDQYFREIKPFPYETVSPEFIAKQRQDALVNPNYLEIYNQVVGYIWTNHLKMVDVGCGNDLLALVFREQGWQTWNIEPNRDAAAYLAKYQLEVINQPVEAIIDFGLKDISFINLQFVLEHIREPETVLKFFNQIMVSGGVIRISVPNDFSEGQLAYLEHYGREPKWVNVPDHINYFTFDSLSRLLERTGFKEVYRTTNFPLELLLLAGKDYYHDEQERVQVGPFVRNFEMALFKTGRSSQLKKLYESLAAQGLGRCIYMYAVKE